MFYNRIEYQVKYVRASEENGLHRDELNDQYNFYNYLNSYLALNVHNLHEAF